MDCNVLITEIFKPEKFEFKKVIMNNSYYNLAIYKFSSFVGEIVPMNCNENSLLSQTQPNFIKNQPNFKPTS
jgi:hypothetical protein